MAASVDTHENFLMNSLEHLQDTDVSSLSRLLRRLLERGKKRVDVHDCNEIEHILSAIQVVLTQLKLGSDNIVNNTVNTVLQNSSQLDQSKAQAVLPNDRATIVDTSREIVFKLCVPCLCWNSVRSTHSASPTSLLHLACSVIACALEANTHFATVDIVPDSFSSDLRRDVVSLCKDSMKRYFESRIADGDAAKGDGAGDNRLPIVTAINVVSTLPDSRGLVKDLGSCLIDVLLRSITVTSPSDVVTSKILTDAIPNILRASEGDEFASYLRRIWDGVLDVGRAHHDERTTAAAAQCLVLCALVDFFLPEKSFFSSCEMGSLPNDGPGENPLTISAESSAGSGLDMVGDDRFWAIVQNGLIDDDPLTRKRAGYLLQRTLSSVESRKLGKTESALFRWSAKCATAYSRLWENYVLLLETLEEKQVHMVKPVMGRLENITVATVQRGDEQVYLHTSWMTTLFHRVFQHDSKFVVRWGVLEFLSLDLTRCPLLQNGGVEFICSVLLHVLNDSALYSRPAEDGIPQFLEQTAELPALAKSLADFFVRLDQSSELSQLPAKRKFFTELLRGICKQNWCAPPLLYVTHALAAVATSAAARETVGDMMTASSLDGYPTETAGVDQEYCCMDVWGSDVVPLLRDLLTSVLRTQQIFLRGAIQCLLLETIMRFLNIKELSAQQLFMLLTTFKRNESLRRHTPLWRHLVSYVCHWVLLPNVNYNDPKDVQRLCSHSIAAFLNVTPDAGKEEFTAGTSDV
ncbi:PREDICTED: uncharacterized protein LOC106811798 [Priapulus caudatus]|uniref:Uncharacterized protein LOC106811798 n=1 Tax=Priapulus caudatus TaxID=37621 RepID=A0ABM1EFN3_PRICU|nr:PREDICTED: uncharacterized protein LOC106811798 [Priapulus caudatus]